MLQRKNIFFSLIGISSSWDSVTGFFVSGFFHESSSPKPLKITLGSFQIFFLIHGDICKWRCTAGGKFSTGINDTGSKFCHRYRWGWYRRCTSSCEYLRELSKKFETALMLSGAWGNWFTYKTWSRKSRGTVPLKGSGKITTASSTPTTNLRSSINNTSGQTFNSWDLHWTWWRRRRQQHRQ